jgi:hypothetical protein
VARKAFDQRVEKRLATDDVEHSLNVHRR